jgi:two-component system NtrC family sensor kinase
LKPSDLTACRILIVDDQVANLNVLATVLEAAGYYNVKCLADSRQFMATFCEFEPDLIMLDLHMPHVDGLAIIDQLAGVIREDDYLPILVLTGDVTSESKQRALARGAHDFLSKPLHGNEVQLRIRNLLQTRTLHLQLKAQNASLEQQVRERTDLAAAIAETNQELEETNRKLRETQAHLIQSEKMASLGQLVAGIAHEINNPLSFLINNIFVVQQGLCQLAAVTSSESFPPEILPKLGRMQTRMSDMQEGATRVKDLVSKLRTFSRLDEGTYKTVNIHESIESVLLFLRHKMEHRIEVERCFGSTEHLSCFAGEFNQVLMNVIANAIDSMPGDGKITITTRSENGQFSISVRDTGKGIPENIRNKIFDPFFTTKPVGDGTGLGLAISYGIVKAHNGSIEFSSREGEGTEFIVKIPTGFLDQVPGASTAASGDGSRPDPRSFRHVSEGITRVG